MPTQVGQAEIESKGITYNVKWRLEADSDITVSHERLGIRRGSLPPGLSPEKWAASILPDMVEADIDRGRRHHWLTRLFGRGMGDIYTGIAGLIGFIVFFACWIYAVAEYGFLIGVLIGWLPSLVVAVIAGLV